MTLVVRRATVCCLVGQFGVLGPMIVNTIFGPLDPAYSLVQALLSLSTAMHVQLSILACLEV
jgi:hypothetical protein